MAITRPECPAPRVTVFSRTLGRAFDGSHLTRAFRERLAPALSGAVADALRPGDVAPR